MTDSEPAGSPRLPATWDAASLLAVLADRQFTVAVSESVTGGLLLAELIGNPGASTVVLGGIVAYDTELKHSLLGVDPVLLSTHGPVHPQVAIQMASGVRDRLAVGGRLPAIGLSTTGVAGPGRQGGQPVGTVFLGLAFQDTALVHRLELVGTRNQIRAAVVNAAISWLGEELQKRRQ